jgi:hypothetical protein
MAGHWLPKTAASPECLDQLDVKDGQILSIVLLYDRPNFLTLAKAISGRLMPTRRLPPPWRIEEYLRAESSKRNSVNPRQSTLRR